MNPAHVRKSRNITNHFFWVLLLQGILAILIAIFVMIYPLIIIPLIAAMFLWQGITALFLATRVRKLWKEMPDLFA
ncbi:MAG TPA: DUF308 domain-containing protein [Candidatus Paceibacterota bacterium]|nr:DUF308 domain-containing protein [Candidatus Paceibacterota bacterium]